MIKLLKFERLTKPTNELITQTRNVLQHIITNMIHVIDKIYVNSGSADSPKLVTVRRRI